MPCLSHFFPYFFPFSSHILPWHHSGQNFVKRFHSTIATKDAHFAFLAIFAPRHAFCCVTSPASWLLLPACCHLLSPPATTAAAACLAKTRPELARVWRSSWGGFWAISSLAGFIALWSTNPPCLHVAEVPIGVASNGCYEWRDAHACCTLWPFFSWFS